MRRLLMLMILAVVGTAQAPEFTNGAPNGLGWMRLGETEKTMAVLGADAGFNEARYELTIMWARAGVEESVCTRSIDNTYRQKVAVKGIIRKDVIREIDAFYNDGANISLPWAYAFTYSEMKLAGATKAELDALQFLK